MEKMKKQIKTIIHKRVPMMSTIGTKSAAAIELPTMDSNRISEKRSMKPSNCRKQKGKKLSFLSF